MAETVEVTPGVDTPAEEHVGAAATTPEPDSIPPSPQPDSLLDDDPDDQGEVERPADPAAPEAYEAFTTPEGVAMDEAALGVATPVFRELNLDQAGAQRLIDLYSELDRSAQSRNGEMLAAHNAALVKRVKEDSELGGANLTQTKALAKAANDKFGSPALWELLKASGMGNEPDVLRFLSRVGRSLSEDTVERGSVTAPSRKAEFTDIYHNGKAQET